MWLVKIAAKIVLKRLPVPYSVWKRLGVFRHGHMETPSYVLGVFRRHARNAPDGHLPPGFTALELGPGNSLASMLVAAAQGAGKIWMVDASTDARTDVAFYKDMARALRSEGVPVPDIEGARSLAEMMEICNAEYRTGGLSSLRAIPAASVDMIWSQAVLEHVRKAEFEATMRELRRILKPSGYASHVIDFKDHLGGALNNLRFPERLWESEFFARSGFYTNRIQAPDMLELFRREGFRVNVLEERRWDALPIARRALDRAFRNVPDDALLVRGLTVAMTP